MTTLRPTGARRSPTEHRLMQSALGHRPSIASSPQVTLYRTIPRLHNQVTLPDCVGEATSAGVEFCSKLLDAPWPSGPMIWTDARRRQGDLEGVHDGTSPIYAIESLTHLGWIAREEGEDNSPPEDFSKMPDVERQIIADDTRIDVKAEHGIISGNQDSVISQINDCLHDTSVSLHYCTGLQEAFFKAPYNVVLGSQYMGGNNNGHDMAISGIDFQRKGIELLNSWRNWGGCKDSVGRDRPQCCLVSFDVLLSAWEIHWVRIR